VLACAPVQRVDVVVVTYNSHDHANDCVASLCTDPRLNVIVVDNDSSDGTADTLEDLPLTLVRAQTNGGFACGCNIGWRKGAAPQVLFLNPDARTTPDDVLRLADVLDAEPRVGAVGPRILETDGSLQHSQRVFPSLRASFGRALFLHRLFPRSQWSFDIARASAYDAPASPDWLSGACLLVRRSLLEALGGFDERFFMYCEDMDLCKGTRNLGYGVRYEPSAVVTHAGGASVPRARTVAIMTTSRLLYAEKHRSALAYTLERTAIFVDSLVHTVITTQGPDARRGFVRSCRVAFLGPHWSRG
jgi:N-acetylglucosaminyl-diphospho-decaprenol L-rhamnosyltransferase